MQPSVYQQAVLDWLVASRGNAIVEAVAGSGKTSMLVMAADTILTDARARRRTVNPLFVAFNKAIATELEARLPRGVEARTWHSVCYSALRTSVQQQVPEARTREWVKGSKVDIIFDSFEAADRNVRGLRKGVKQLVGLMKANALLPDASDLSIDNIILKYDIVFDEDSTTDRTTEGITLARQVLQANNDDLSMIDFDDQLYLTCIRDVRLQVRSHIMIDEAQDTNRVQRILLGRMMASYSRLVAVGDPFQAIYGFRGADSDAMNAIEREFHCTTFPLSVSYRCSASVVQFAQSIVPHITARDNAPQGTVSMLDNWKLDDFELEDMIVCRNNAPLIELAFRFIRAHKAVKVMGRDIGQQLITLVKKMNANSLEQLADRLEEYQKREVNKALAKHNEGAAQRIEDQCSSLIAVIEGLPENEHTTYDLISRIDSLFTDNTNGHRTTLASIHKSKGMESRRVFVLDAHLMPSKYATQGWQLTQESNLRYVAITRALDTLYFVDGASIA